MNGLGASRASLSLGRNLTHGLLDKLGKSIVTALRTSIRFTNRFKRRTASLPAHKAVKDAIEARDTAGAHAAMASIIREVRMLIAEAEAAEASRPSA